MSFLQFVNGSGDVVAYRPEPPVPPIVAQPIEQQQAGYAPNDFAAMLAQRRERPAAEAALVANPWRRGRPRMLPADVIPLPGGVLEAWFLALLESPRAGSRVRIVGGESTFPYATCFGSLVSPMGEAWCLLDHLTNGHGAAVWLRDRLCVDAGQWAQSAYPDPAGAVVIPVSELRRRMLRGWELRNHDLLFRRQLTADRPAAYTR